MEVLRYFSAVLTALKSGKVPAQVGIEILLRGERLRGTNERRLKDPRSMTLPLCSSVSPAMTPHAAERENSLHGRTLR
jgi:hypothetical protein